MDGDGGGITQLTTTRIAREPFCTPDSRKVYFTIEPKPRISPTYLWSVLLSEGTPRVAFEFKSVFIPVLARDTKLALELVNINSSNSMQIWNLSTHQMVHQLPLDMRNEGRTPVFSPDGKAIVAPIISNGSRMLKYQPIDGSPMHLMTDQAGQTAYVWSPSGSKLGVLQGHGISDVVLITDLAGKR
jgi:Tol biopolymer transport system component